MHYRQERWDKSALTRCAPRSTHLRQPLRHNRPLPPPPKLLPPLTSPSRALGTLAKLTSVIDIIGWSIGPNRTIDLMLKSLESTTELNHERSPKRVPRLLGEGSRRAAGRLCKASIRSSTRFLRPRTLESGYSN